MDDSAGDTWQTFVVLLLIALRKGQPLLAKDLQGARGWEAYNTEKKQRQIAIRLRRLLQPAVAMRKGYLVIGNNTEGFRFRDHVQSDVLPLEEHDAIREWIYNRESSVGPRASVPEMREPPFAMRERTEPARRLSQVLRDQREVLVVMAGGPGNGKTTLVEQFVRNHSTDYERFCWIDVRDCDGKTVTIASALLRALDARGLGGLIPADAPAILAALSNVFTRRQTGAPRILLVLDNADHPDGEFKEFVQGLRGCPGAVVLITTRDQGLAADLDAHEIPVGRFTPEEGIEYLSAWLVDHPERGDRAAVAEIARRLVYWPLGLKLAGAYLKGRPKKSLQSYQGELPSSLSGESVPGSLAVTRHHLDESDDALFVAVSACAPGGFGVAAAAASAGVALGVAEPGLIRLCRRLATKSRTPNFEGVNIANLLSKITSSI